MTWLQLIIAGILETVWALLLKRTDGFTRLVPSLLTAVTMLFSFYFLGRATRQLPMGTAYAVWTGIGAAGVCLFEFFVLAEQPNPWRLIWVAVIISGISGLYLTQS